MTAGVVIRIRLCSHLESEQQARAAVQEGDVSPRQTLSSPLARVR